MKLILFASASRILFWLTITLLLVVAVGLVWRGVSPEPSRLESLVKEIRDPKFQSWYAQVQIDKEKAAVRTALDAYSRKYGSSVWAKHAAEELVDGSRPRYYDLAELALSIDSGDDRLEFAEAHAKTYSLIIQSGVSEIASAYVQHLASLRNKGGRNWRIARTSPLAVVVHTATETSGKTELWTWYIDNREWVDDYLCAIQIDPESDTSGETLIALLEEFRRRTKVYRAFRNEVMDNGDAKSSGQKDDELTPSEFLASSMPVIALYGDTFEVLCDANIPFSEALDVFANNIGDLNFETPNVCHETGVELANLYRSHRAVWDAAAVPGGNGAIRFFREVPQFAETVLAQFGEANILPFLMQNYAESSELLSTAAEVISRYDTVGWSVLAHFAGNEEFKNALLNKDVGHLVVPYVALKGGDSTAVSQCLRDPGWVKRYLNPDGSFKPETETIIEAMPFVGGIATVLKHKMRGDPVEMGEVGWAVFDVADSALTVVAIVGSAGAATPAVAAKQAAVQGAKTGTKITIKQSTKQLAKQSAKLGGKYVARKGGAVIVRNGVKATTKHEAKNLARRTLFRRLAQTTGKTATWTMRAGGKTLHIVASPVTKSVQAWRRLPPPMRKTILRTAAATMFFIAISERTLPKLGPAIHETLKRTGAQLGSFVDESVKGMGDFFIEAIKSSTGATGVYARLLYIAIGIAFFIMALLLVLRHFHRSLVSRRIS